MGNFNFESGIRAPLNGATSVAPICHMGDYKDYF